MKRGSSGLSLIVGVDKPEGMSSHDVVNRCRRIFGERRVGHTGTLDPLATGVLPICIGPATRLDQFMTSHDKRYRVRIGFGYETTTDDKLGEMTTSAAVPAYLFDEKFARERVAMLVRQHTQVPPQYSAIKVDGKKAYEVARSGGTIELEPRIIEVYEAELIDMREGEDGLSLQWTVDVSVSKGTYIRSLVRDLGREVMCPAHVTALCRLEGLLDGEIRASRFTAGTAPSVGGGIDTGMNACNASGTGYGLGAGYGLAGGAGRGTLTTPELMPPELTPPEWLSMDVNSIW